MWLIAAGAFGMLGVISFVYLCALALAAFVRQVRDE